MTESERVFLTNRNQIDELASRFDVSEQIVSAALAELALQSRGAIEMIENRLFSFGRDDDQLVEPGVACFFDPILKNRLVDQRQHLLRDHLRGWKEPRAEAGTGKDASPQVIHRRARITAPQVIDTELALAE